MSSTKRGRSLAEMMSPIEDEPGTGTPTMDVAEPAGGMRADRDASTENGPAAIVPVNIQVTPEDRRRLRQLSLDTNLSLQKLGHEAWNLLLQKRGLPPLRPVSASVPSGRNARPTRK